MQSDAATVADYLSALPEDRRAAIETVRQTILENLPDGYEEVMNWGMITYEVPLADKSSRPPIRRPASGWMSASRACASRSWTICRSS